MRLATHRGQLWLPLAWLMVAMLAGPAGASPAALAWTAPPECPDASRLAKRIEALSGVSAARWPRGWLVRAHAVRDAGTDGAWRLSIEFSGNGAGGRRVIDGESCVAVVEAAALHIALGLEQARQRAWPAATVARPVSTRTQAAWVGASGLAELGALPGPSGGVALRIGVDLGRLGAELRAAAVLGRRAELAEPAGAAADIALYWTEPAICVAASIARGCAGMQLGWITGRGIGVDRPRREGSVWVAPQVSLALALPLSARFALELRALAARPLVRPRFELESGVLLHQPDWIAGHVSVGAGWRFH